MRLKEGVLVTAFASLTACSTIGIGSDTTGTSGSGIFRTGKVEIRECGTQGAPRTRIAYPTGWETRVSQAETEGELLGGPSQSVETSADVKAISRPAIQYPPAALSPPIEARCEVKLDLSTMGEASNLLAACSNPLFLDEVTRIVRETRFEPLEVNGMLARGVNLVYPFNFCLADDIR